MEFLDRCGHYNPNLSNFIVAPLTSIDSISELIGKRPPPNVNILYPFWELSKIPENLRPIIEYFDHIYAPSQFIAETFGSFLNKEVSILPLPVEIPDVYPVNSLIDGDLKIFGLVDLDSWEGRKNPRGIVDAFLLAFPLGSTNNVQLILKIRGGYDSNFRQVFATSFKEDSRIKLIDEVLTKEQIHQLMSQCNVYLSLHRSEGFGLGPAEAMALGKIVIATDYGGTRDFVNSKTGFPIKFKLIPVSQKDYPHADNQVWADPDINYAASILKFINENFDDACKIAEYGRNSLCKTHSVEAVSKLIEIR